MLEFACHVLPWNASLFFVLPDGRSQHRRFSIETKRAGLGGGTPLLEVVECFHLAPFARAGGNSGSGFVFSVVRGGGRSHKLCSKEEGGQDKGVVNADGKVEADFLPGPFPGSAHVFVGGGKPGVVVGPGADDESKLLASRGPCVSREGAAASFV